MSHSMLIPPDENTTVPVIDGEDSSSIGHNSITFEDLGIPIRVNLRRTIFGNVSKILYFQ